MHGMVARGHLVAIGVVALITVVGCGSDNDSETPSETPAKSAEQRAPETLFGEVHDRAEAE